MKQVGWMAVDDKGWERGMDGWMDGQMSSVDVDPKHT